MTDFSDLSVPANLARAIECHFVQNETKTFGPVTKSWAAYGANCGYVQMIGVKVINGAVTVFNHYTGNSTVITIDENVNFQATLPLMEISCTPDNLEGFCKILNRAVGVQCPEMRK